MALAKTQRTPLTDDEREGIILAVSSAFRKLKNLYTKIVPIFEDFSFTPPAAGVIARDLSEKIEKAIIQHCESFSKVSSLKWRRAFRQPPTTRRERATSTN